MPSASIAHDRLASLVMPDGGWGYQPGQSLHLEPTCLAMLALAGDLPKYGALVDKGHQALEANRAADGTYRLARGRPQAVWATALVLFTEHALSPVACAPGSPLAATAEKLLAIESRIVKVEDDEVADMKID